MSVNSRRLFAQRVLAASALAAVGWSAWAPAPAGGQNSSSRIPISFTLPRAACLTLVIEDAQGRRVRNLVGETRFPAGRSTVLWDGYDEGTSNAGGALTRYRVAPGKYWVRGLTHGGIKLRYEVPFNSPGTPPWHTADRSGAWMADHSPPSAVVFLPPGSGSPYGHGQAQLLVAADVGEVGHTLIWTNLQGRKLYGGEKIGGWHGGMALARDAGAAPGRIYYAYDVLLEEKSIQIYGFKRDGSIDKIAVCPTETAIPEPERRMAGAGIAVYNGLIVTSAPRDNKLFFVDAASKVVLGSVAVPSPKGLHFDGNGRLYVASGMAIKRFGVATGKAELQDEATFISTSLEDPRQMATDAAGNFYVSDWGHSHQVKVFNAQGKFLRAIGNAGGIQLGRYDERRMQNPIGLTIDSEGKLWVAECDGWPRRLSCWNSDGRFLKSFIGPPQYGGGGTLDAHDPTRLFYAQYGNVMEFQIDWKNGTSRLVGIPIRRELMGSGVRQWQEVSPERALHLKGFTYLIGTFNGNLRGNDNTMTFKLGADGVAWPVAFVGGDRWWLSLGTDPSVYDRPDNPERLVTWSDLNEDHQVQKDEIRFRTFTETYTGSDGQQRRPSYFLGNTLAPDLSMSGAFTIHVDAPAISAHGIPIYNLETARFLMKSRQEFFAADQGMLTSPAKDNWIITNKDDWRGYKNGQLMWTYHACGSATPPQFGGQMVDPTRILGPLFTPPSGQAGEMWAINGEKGNIYLLTTDGLWVQTLGADARSAPLLRTPVAKRGMVIGNVSFADEPFHPTITRTDRGGVFVSAGHEFSALFRVEGLDTVQRRRFGTVEVSPAQLASLPATRIEAQRAQQTQELAVRLLDAPLQVDGSLDDWQGSAFVRLDDEASASVAVSGNVLFGAWKTGNPNVLANRPSDLRFLFKTGGALDLQIATRTRGQGGQDNLRLLVARVNGHTRAILYRDGVQGVREEERVLFESPVGRVTLDRVEDVTEQVKLAQRGGDYEISVPLSVLHFAPRRGAKIPADIGLLRGNGSQTTRRTYWNNLNTVIVSDIPSEVCLQPGNWGIFSLGQK